MSQSTEPDKVDLHPFYDFPCDYSDKLQIIFKCLSVPIYKIRIMVLMKIYNRKGQLET